MRWSQFNCLPKTLRIAWRTFVFMSFLQFLGDHENEKWEQYQIFKKKSKGHISKIHITTRNYSNFIWWWRLLFGFLPITVFAGKAIFWLNHSIRRALTNFFKCIRNFFSGEYVCFACWKCGPSFLLNSFVHTNTLSCLPKYYLCRSNDLI